MQVRIKDSISFLKCNSSSCFVVCAFIFFAFLLASSSSNAACPAAEEVTKFVEDFKAKRPNGTFTPSISSEEDAWCAREALLGQFSTFLGPVVGYKAALTHDQIRRAMLFDEPFFGVMFGRDLFESPARVSAQYGAVPFWEIDMLVEVKDAKLADAKTPMEAIKHISAFIPFVELADAMTPGQPPRTFHFIAGNVGFRSGVLGKKISVQPNKKFVDAFANMKIIATSDESGAVILDMKGSELMDGNPLNVAIWLAKKLKTKGIELKPGDLLSLGGPTSQIPNKDTSITVRYIGFPSDPAVKVQFE